MYSYIVHSHYILKVYQSHTPCIFKWLEISNSCPICRHEVEPARTQRERYRAGARSRQINLSSLYGSMLDEWKDKEANDAARTQVLLDDAVTNPAQPTGAEASMPMVVAGSGPNTAAPVAIGGEKPNEPPSPVVRTTAPNGIPWTRGISRAPPMVGGDEGLPEELSGYPSMDDPSKIFSNGSPIQAFQIPVAIPPPTLSESKHASPVQADMDSERQHESPPVPMVYRLNTKVPWEERALGTSGILPRVGHCASSVSSVIEKKLFLFGGHGPRNAENSVHIIDIRIKQTVMLTLSTNGSKKVKAWR